MRQAAHDDNLERMKLFPRAVRPFLFFVSVAFPLVWRDGYSYGLQDHLVLLLKGLVANEPSAWLNDVFVQSAPQPHWLFDLWVECFDRVGLLGFGLFIFWFLAVWALSTAFDRLSDLLFGERWWLGLLTGAVIALGPISAGGSTGPVLGWALPHALGASLLLLSLVTLASGRERQAWLFAAASALVHLQQGAHCALFLGVWTVGRIGKDSLFRARSAALAGLLAVVLISAKRSGLTATGADFVRLCRVYIPYHCFAPSWPLTWVVESFFIAACSSIVILKGRRSRPALASAWIMAALFLITIVSDRMNVPLLGDWVRRLNFHRLVSPLVALTAFAFVFPLRAGFSWTRAVLATAGLGYWWSTFSAFQSESFVEAAGESIGFAFLIFCLFVLEGVLEKAVGKKKISVSFRQWTLPSFTVLLTAVFTIIVLPRLPDISNSATRNFMVWGEQIRRATPMGSVILADPAWIWLRLYSKRAIVADFKAKPYGGAPLADWENRIALLTGTGSENAAHGFVAMSARRLEEVALQFKARYIILSAEHGAVSEARKKWKLAAEPRLATSEGGVLRAFLFELP